MAVPLSGSAPSVTAVQPTSIRRWRRARLVVMPLAALLVLVAAILGGVGWYFSDQLLHVTHAQKPYTLHVTAAGVNTVTLQRTRDTARPGTFGLGWPGGHAVVGVILKEDGSSVTRRLTGKMTGLAAGVSVRLDASVYAGNPGTLGLRYTDVAVPDPLGPMPAWYLAGRRSTWVIEVHGYNSSRLEGLRVAPALTTLGLPVLDLSYRNDVGAPPSPDGLYHLGATEWQDVEAGVRYALTHGAHDVILYGWSMGGGTVESFLHRSAYAPRVRAVVLDAPALDWNAVLDLQGRERHLPGVLIAVAQRIVAARLGMSDLAPIDQVRAAGSLTAPTLLFHGDEDTVVPVGSSDAFARARPDIVTYRRVAGADHTQAWNVAPTAYTATLTTFLTREPR